MSALRSSLARSSSSHSPPSANPRTERPHGRGNALPVWRLFHEVRDAPSGVAPVDEELDPAAVQPVPAPGVPRHLAHHPELLGVVGEEEAQAELGPELEAALETRAGRRARRCSRPCPSSLSRSWMEARPVLEPDGDALFAPRGHGHELLEAAVPEEGVDGHGKDGVGARADQRLRVLGGRVAAVEDGHDRGGPGPRVARRARTSAVRLRERGQAARGPGWARAARAASTASEALRTQTRSSPLPPEARVLHQRRGILGRDDQDLGQRGLRVIWTRSS